MPRALQGSVLLLIAKEDLDQGEIHPSFDQLNGSQPFHANQWNPGFDLIVRVTSREKSNRIKIRTNYEKVPAGAGLYYLEYA